jgi:hypothetical protein
MSTQPHTKIINKVAREVLKPIGVTRKGQSRVWLDDNGWWVTVVEFQPSAWSKGTYLNIGVNWQWYPKDHFSFDLGYREASFIEYISDDQFEPKARELAEMAKAKVEEFRRSLSNQISAKEYIVSKTKEDKGNLWGEFNRGMACAITGSKEQALNYFKQVIENPHDVEWAIELKDFTRNMMNLISSGQDHIGYINKIVKEARALKKLEENENILEKIA